MFGCAADYATYLYNILAFASGFTLCSAPLGLSAMFIAYVLF